MVCLTSSQSESGLGDVSGALDSALEACKRAGSAWLASYREGEAEAGLTPEYSQHRERIEWIPGMTHLLDLEGLFLLATTVRPQECIVEIGSFCGRATTALAFGAGCRDRVVVTVDPHTGDVLQLERLSDTHPSSESALRFHLAFAAVASAVEVVTSTSLEAAEAFQDPRPVGLLFVDGWHGEDAVAADVAAWSPFLGDDAIVVFDDWIVPEVMSGIRSAEDQGLLPPRLGRIHRHLIFSSRPRVAPVLPRLRALAQLSKPPRQYLRERAARLLPVLAHPVVGPRPVE